jgi:phosphoribosyl-AMP cyclohydrolase / phosphoribosyl-ATP pyrophosphohydrolase
MTTRDFKFDVTGLIPAIVQDWLDGTVLMLGYMNEAALTKTLSTKSVHFWSRSRQTLWEKGETSGNKLLVK